VTNAEICENIESSDEWIQDRSGIIERRHAPADVTIIDMAVSAAEKAIADAGLTAADIDNVIVSTISHPYQTPSAAVFIADRLGIPNPGAMDISAACAGFCYAIGMADAEVSTGQSKNTLVIGVEKLSEWIDINDRGTAFIFADGAGAVIVSPSDTAQIGPTLWGSDGSNWDAIVMSPGLHELRSADPKKIAGEFPVLRMQGQKVFRWTVSEMPKIAHAAIEAAGLTPADIDVFVPHQANLRITKAMMKALGFPETIKVAEDIQYSGNTSAASIPLALDQLRSTGVAKSGDIALLIGFGAGLAYASQVVRVP
jgi:3-oxoacyl-(acyl-carrier-protein) synthase III